MTIHTIMTEDESGKELVEFARQTADTLVKNNLTRSQIRNIFTEVRQIEATWDQDSKAALRQLMLLKPKMAYQEARSSSVAGLRKVLDEAIDEVGKSTSDADRAERFQRFVNLFEAILAYHRAFGGRN